MAVLPITKSKLRSYFDVNREPSIMGLGYRYDFEGIRGIVAILTVLGHTLNNLIVRYVPGLWPYLNAWIMLSGFLVTIMLLDDVKRNGRPRLRNFYLRRAFRLLPALFLLAAVVGIWLLFMAPSTYKTTVELDTLSVFGMFFNIRIAMDKSTLFSPWSTLWTLSFEEQFYIVWSLLILFSSRLKSVFPLICFTIFGTVFATIERIVLVADRATWNRLYFAPDTRMDTLMIGSLLGIFVNQGYFKNISKNTRKVLASLSILSAMLLGYVVATTNIYQMTTFSIWTLLTNVAFAFIIIYLSNFKDSWLSKILSFNIFVWLGVRSYGLYLYHYFLVVYFNPQRTHLTLNELAFLWTVSSFLVAALSWRVLERPINKWRVRKFA